MDPRLRHDFGNATSVRSALFDPASGVVEITFKGGKVTSYGGLTPDLWDEWTSQPAPGKWFHEKIRQRPSSHPEIQPEQIAPAPIETGVETTHAEFDPEGAARVHRHDRDAAQATATTPEPAQRARPFTTATPPDPEPPAYKSALARARASKKKS